MDKNKELLCKSIESFLWDKNDSSFSARTFMRTLGKDTSVGLLLFDEPSAALDPVAEHGMTPCLALWHHW